MPRIHDAMSSLKLISPPLYETGYCMLTMHHFCLSEHKLLLPKGQTSTLCAAQIIDSYVLYERGIQIFPFVIYINVFETAESF